MGTKVERLKAKVVRAAYTLIEEASPLNVGALDKRKLTRLSNLLHELTVAKHRQRARKSRRRA